MNKLIGSLVGKSSDNQVREAALERSPTEIANSPELVRLSTSALQGFPPSPTKEQISTLVMEAGPVSTLLASALIHTRCVSALLWPKAPSIPRLPQGRV